MIFYVMATPDKFTDAFQRLALSEEKDEQESRPLDDHSNFDKWKREQESLRQKLLEENTTEVLSWNPSFSNLHFVGGVDVSFQKDEPDVACATLVVLSFPDLTVLKEYSKVIRMTEPYKAGYLAFREASHLLDRLQDLKIDSPALLPQVLLVDGNGVLHPRGFGLACHLGVCTGIPCIGIGKKLHHIDGLVNDAKMKDKINQILKKKGDFLELKGASGRSWGCALRTSDDATNPVYVSVGHKISLQTAIDLCVKCSLKRVPEPVRMADILSRKKLRERVPD